MKQFAITLLASVLLYSCTLNQTQEELDRTNTAITQLETFIEKHTRDSLDLTARPIEVIVLYDNADITEGSIDIGLLVVQVDGHLYGITHRESGGIDMIHLESSYERFPERYPHRNLNPRDTL